MPFVNSTTDRLYIIYSRSRTYAYVNPCFVASFACEGDRDTVLDLMKDPTGPFETDPDDTLHAGMLLPGESITDL